MVDAWANQLQERMEAFQQMPASSSSQNPDELDRIYGRRFDGHIAYRNQIWQLLTAKFFPRYISPDSAVLDLGCGYGEFINNIQCSKKYAMDLNPGTKRHLSSQVQFLEQDCSLPWGLPDDSLDVVFTSNFFEHLLSKQLLADTINQAKRCIRPGGRLIALGPNIRFIGGAYWDFFDHHIALTDLSLKELFDIQGLQVEVAIDRFLPYTMVNARRVPMGLVECYLKVPLAWKILGKQFLIIAKKIK
jgi:SAM-dependent methyltransferase